jgi:ABC-type multidrug transport system ATPase subunit
MHKAHRTMTKARRKGRRVAHAISKVVNTDGFQIVLVFATLALLGCFTNGNGERPGRESRCFMDDASAARSADQRMEEANNISLARGNISTALHASLVNPQGFDLSQQCGFSCCIGGNRSAQREQGQSCSGPDGCFPRPPRSDSNSDICSFETGTPGPSCAGGAFRNASGRTASCPPGYYCPPNRGCLAPCKREGALCLNARHPNEEEAKCPAGFFCPNPVTKIICPGSDDAGYFVSRGEEEDGKPAGERISFIQGSILGRESWFCPLGSVAPKPCPKLAICGRGAAAPDRKLLPAFILGLVALFWLTKKCLGQCSNPKGSGDTLELLESEAFEGRLRRRVPRGISHARHLHDRGKARPSRAPSRGEQVEQELEQEEERKEKARKDFRISIEMQNLGLELKANREKKVVAGVNGFFNHSEVCAIMGPSGAGKTSVLSTVSGRAGSYGVTTGSIIVNGDRKSTSGLARFSKVVGFVPQDDTMHRDLTVRETLHFQAELRLPTSLSEEEVVAAVNRTMTVLGIIELADARIGDEDVRGISGGQRKRVNIGMELVAQPKLLFLDEPTSGLDSTSSREVVTALRRVAVQDGMNVVVVLHQPSFETFSQFHKVLLLAKGGHTVYLGRTEGALPYFERLGYECPERMNPSDFFMDAIAGLFERQGLGRPDLPHELHELWAQSQQKVASRAEAGDLSQYSAAAAMVPTGGFLLQMLLFQRRAVLQKYGRHGMAELTSVVGVHMIAALAIGLLFQTGTEQSAFNLAPYLLTSIHVGMTEGVAACDAFGAELTIFRREASCGFSRLAYFCGKCVAELPHLLAAALVFSTTYIMVATPAINTTAMISAIAVAMWAVSGVGYAISLATARNSQISLAVFVLASATVGGVSPTLPELGVFGIVLADVSYARYLIEALFGGNVARFSQVWCPESLAMLRYHGYDAHGYAGCLMRLFWIGLAGRLVTAALLLKDGRGTLSEMACAACAWLARLCQSTLALGPTSSIRFHGTAKEFSAQNPTWVTASKSGWHDLPDGRAAAGRALSGNNGTEGNEGADEFSHDALRSHDFSGANEPRVAQPAPARAAATESELLNSTLVRSHQFTQL